MLESLNGGPKQVSGYFSASGSAIKTLEGAPQEVKNDLYLYKCLELKSLKGGPHHVGGDLVLNYCPNLTTLKYGPISVGGLIKMHDTPVPRLEKDVYLSDELREDWINSGLEAEEFLHRRRGKLKGRKFGI